MCLGGTRQFIDALCAILAVILLLLWSAKEAEFRRVRYGTTALAILAALSVSLALAEDFKTVSGKLYKDATIVRVEADGIVVRTKTGISKIYFIELPKDVQGRFRPSPSPSPSPAKTAAAQREPEPIKSEGWRAVIANQTAFIIRVFAGVIVIAGVVFLVVRRKRAKSK